jgi:hypothetical protein
MTDRSFFYKLGCDMVAAKIKYFIGQGLLLSIVIQAKVSGVSVQVSGLRTW